LKDPLSYQVQQLLTHSNINLDKIELAFQIESHPSYPSLHAITGVLNHFNIDNIALEVPVDEVTLTQLPTSFLAQIQTPSDREFAVVLYRGTYYEIIQSNKKKSKLTTTEFLAIFTGIMVAVEKTELVVEKRDHTPFLNNALIVITLSLIFSLFFLTKPNISSILFFLGGLLGIFVSIALKKQEQGVKTLLGDALCSGQSEIKDCDAVLTSKGASILGTYQLSDLSLIYFSGVALSVFGLTLFQLDISLLYVISFLVLPITFYSLYYQYAVVKKWCLLCLSVVGLLWLQAVIVAVDFELITTLAFPLLTLLLTATSFITAITVWHLLAPTLAEVQRLRKIKVEHFKFKRDFDIFNALLVQSEVIDTHIESTAEIVFGNPDAPLQITIITSPFCGHCKPVHILIENMYRSYSEQVNIRIRIATSADDPKDTLFKITTRLLELYHTQSHEACLNAMHAIYTNPDPAQWFETFGTCQDTTPFIGTVQQESEWCQAHELNFTPVILINGRSYPKAYDREDLLYFIEELYENCSEEDIVQLQETM